MQDTITQLFVSGVVFFVDISTHTGYHTDTYRGTPYRIRTGVAAVKGQCPRPLDEGCILGSGGENRTPIMGFGDPYTAIVLHRKVWWVARDSNPVCPRRRIYSPVQ